MNLKIEQKYIYLLIISLIILCLDQATKIYVHTHFQFGESISVISNYFDLTYVRNTGVAFGFLGEMPDPYRKIVLLSFPIIMAVIILMFIRGAKNQDLWQVFSLSLIFGGDIGNFIDRLMFGYVVDFFNVHYQDKLYWPVFNIADIAIVVGVFSMLLWGWLSPYAKENSTAN